MALFVYVSEQCSKDAKRHGYSTSLDSIVKKLEKEQNLALFDAFPPPYLVRKQFGDKQGRLIAARKDIHVGDEDHVVVILLAILIRGSNDYDSRKSGFGHAPVEYGNSHFVPMLEQIVPTLPDFIHDRTASNPPPEKPKLSVQEKVFLSQSVSSGLTRQDILVGETKDWVDSVEQWDNRLLGSISRSIAALCVDDLQPGLGRRPLVDNPGLAISFHWDPEKQRLTLRKLLSAEDADNLPEQTRVFRSYPAWMALEDGLLRDIEKDTYGNMALSDEENDVLYPKDGNRRFPLFINGRAGSGKSTILQYLFAEFFARYAVSERPFNNPPAYFACNEELIRKAQECVTSVLDTNPAYENTVAIREALRDISGFRRSFRVFREHLLSLLKTEERIKSFPEDKYIDYAAFVRRWEAKFGNDPAMVKECGADISWHVIRTFIKGTSVDGIMEADEYELLPKNQRSVSSDLFGKIYQKVWTAWYKKETERVENHGNGFWDDQDLVRYLLVNNRFSNPETKFPAIFCDEAQDFTQIEIVVFLKMSAFSERKIFPHEIASLPFVFAGDEFQTLNPTGFSWDAVKGMFHEKFIRGLCPSAKTELVDRDLKNNYRSVGEIVRFSNSVQLLRAARFGNRQLEPQREWNDEVGHPIAYFDRDSKALWDGLRIRNDVHIIVPCHANEEISFIRNDPILSSVISIDESRGTTTPRVLSAVRAKGLEYQCVVVYGFGACLGSDALVDGDGIATWSGDAERMAMEYFLNRLYVAVSRPRNQLYIVDSEEGVSHLWRFAQNNNSLRRLAAALPRNGEWTAGTQPWVQGNNQMLEPTYRVDYRALAEQDERAADATQDAAQMFQAAEWYRILGDQRQKELECLGKAHLFKGQYEEAGKCFEQIDRFDMAGESYWKMSNSIGWKRMCNLAKFQNDLAGRPPYVIAKTLADNRVGSIPSTLQYILSAIENSGVGSFQTTEWRAAISSLVNLALDARADSQKDILEKLVQLGKQGFTSQLLPHAKKAFKAEWYGLAKELFELAGETSATEYLEATALVSSYPDNLVSLARLGGHETRILADYENNPTLSLDDAQKEIVAEVLWRSGRRADFAKICGSITAKSAFMKLDSLGEEAKLFVDELAVILQMRNRKEAEYTSEVPRLIQERKFKDWFVVRVMARAHNQNEPSCFIDAPPREQTPVFKYLDGLLASWPRDALLAAKVPAYELGAALELFGKRNSAVQFYERALEIGETDVLRRRLLAAKRKKLQLLRKQKKVSNIDYKNELRKLDDEAASFGLTMADIPDDPPSYDWEELKQIIILSAFPTVQHSDTNRSDAQSASSEPSQKEESSFPVSAATAEASGQGGPRNPEPETLRDANFMIDGKYRIQWWPKRHRVRITIESPESDCNGDSWTLEDAGVTGDGIESAVSGGGADAVRLPNTPFVVHVSTANGIRVLNKENGICLQFGCTAIS